MKLFSENFLPPPSCIFLFQTDSMLRNLYHHASPLQEPVVGDSPPLYIPLFLTRTQLAFDRYFADTNDLRV
jgi:hypothetical protein